MTCVVASSWHPFGDSSPWSSMNPDLSSSHHDGLERHVSHGYLSSGSESRKPASSSSGKKRASRAGTRSVSTLSAAQLERKRANDREAQRAIRQRTKDHIDHLERTVSDLRGTQESHEKLVATTQQRNRELEEENAYLRGRLNEAGFSYNVTAERHGSDPSLLSVHPSTSPNTAHPSIPGAAIGRPASASAPRALPIATSQPSSARHGPLQQGPGFMTGPPSAPASASAMAAAPTMAAWRPQEGWTPSAPSLYAWPGAQESRTQTFEQQPPPPQQPQSYPHAVQGFSPGPSAPPQRYHPPQLPPTTEYQSMAIPAPANYPSGDQQSFAHPQAQPGFPTTAPQPTPYTQQHPPPPQSYQHHQPPPTFQMGPIQVPPSPGGEYTSSHGQMQPPPIPTTTYHQAPAEAHYVPQAHAEPMPFRDETGAHTYALTHYSSG